MRTYGPEPLMRRQMAPPALEQMQRRIVAALEFDDTAGWTVTSGEEIVVVQDNNTSGKGSFKLDFTGATYVYDVDCFGAAGNGLDLTHCSSTIRFVQLEEDVSTSVKVGFISAGSDPTADGLSHTCHTYWGGRSSVDGGNEITLGNPNLVDALNGGNWVVGADFDVTDVTGFFFYAYCSTEGGAVFYIDTVKIYENDVRARVLFTVDDGYESDYTSTAPILEGLGWRGIFSIIPENVGEVGYMTLDQLKDLNERGHVLAGHGLAPWWGLTLAEQRAQMRATFQYFEDNKLGSSSRLWVFPSGFGNPTEADPRESMRMAMDEADIVMDAWNCTPYGLKSKVASSPLPNPWPYPRCWSRWPNGANLSPAVADQATLNTFISTYLTGPRAMWAILMHGCEIIAEPAKFQMFCDTLAVLEDAGTVEIVDPTSLMTPMARPSDGLPLAAPDYPQIGDRYLDDSTDRLYTYVTGGWKYVALTAGG